MVRGKPGEIGHVAHVHVSSTAQSMRKVRLVLYNQHTQRDRETERHRDIETERHRDRDRDRERQAEGKIVR